MKILVLGATGSVGSLVVKEALLRGHDVTAVARSINKDVKTDAKFVVGDAANSEEVAQLSKGQDVVISAIRPVLGQEDTVAKTTKALLAGIRETDARLLIMGGAASLIVPNSDGKTVIDDANYLSPKFRAVGQASIDQLEVCLAGQEVDWVYLCPSATFESGARTANYRIGTKELLVDSEGISKISMEDAAVALLNEAEKPQYHRETFTIGY